MGFIIGVNCFSAVLDDRGAEVNGEWRGAGEKGSLQFNRVNTISASSEDERDGGGGGGRGAEGRRALGLRLVRLGSRGPVSLRGPGAFRGTWAGRSNHETAKDAAGSFALLVGHRNNLRSSGILDDEIRLYEGRWR